MLIRDFSGLRSLKTINENWSQLDWPGTSLRFVHPGDGSITNPFLKISDAVSVIGTGARALFGCLVKPQLQLVSGLPLLQAIKQIEDDEYYIGLDKTGNPLPDGETLDVPAGVTLMIDEGAVFNMRQSNIDVGSSSPLVSREQAAIQVLGTPSNRVVFTGYRDSEFRENAVIYDLNLPYVTANVTDVVAAALVGTLDTAGLAQGVTLSSDGITAYVADQSAGLQIINLSDPANASASQYSSYNRQRRWCGSFI